MPKFLEQRYSIKFAVKLGKSPTETVGMINQAYGESAMSRNMIFRWHKMFVESREEVDDEPRPGRPSTTLTDENVQKIRHKLNSDRRLSVRMIAEECNMPKTIVHEIIRDQLGMRKICAKLVPKVLSDDQRLNRLEIATQLADRCKNDPNFLENVVSGDETWVFEYDPESKRQSAEWQTPASPRQKKARMSTSRIKAMLIVFFDKRGVVHHEFVPEGQTVNAAFYVQVLDRLRKRVARVRPEIKNIWRLQHDNAPSHTALVVSEFLTKHGVATLPHPLYSPDLAPPDFFLFPKIKRSLKGTRYGTLDAVKEAVTTCLREVPDDAFARAFQEWERRWDKCIDSQGTYFEEY
ncbi:protein GVQW3-like [Nylanderia fulva]|uniref:protein GVQW3-like n=1 Tax=Nylanderia fulva TaxID=613905 RepID=UPI0010FB40AA|nr:protein GVQW3-like [Nylanderia fulva]